MVSDELSGTMKSGISSSRKTLLPENKDRGLETQTNLTDSGYASSREITIHDDEDALMKERSFHGYLGPRRWTYVVAGSAAFAFLDIALVHAFFYCSRRSDTAYRAVVVALVAIRIHDFQVC